jgi:hypothetical protein
MCESLRDANCPTDFARGATSRGGGEASVSVARFAVSMRRLVTVQTSAFRPVIPENYLRLGYTRTDKAEDMPTNIEQIKRAIQLTEQIEKLQAELNQVLAGWETGNGLVRQPSQPRAAKAGRKKGKMSAAGRAAIIAAQKARWAKFKAAKAGRATPAASVKASVPKKRSFSAATKAKMAAAQKARWARRKKGKA